MNTQIHRKQVIILVLAMVLAAGSYWIPLPQQSKPYPSSILRESTSLSTPTEAIAYAREPAAIWRFPVTIQTLQTPIQAASAPQTKKPQPDQTLPATRLMDQRDFTNNGTVNFPLMPVKELNYDLKQ